MIRLWISISIKSNFISIGDGTGQVWFDSNFMSNEPDKRLRCENSYGNYSTKKDALKACESDSYCEMVYDDDCDDLGVFTLCNKLEKSVSSSVESCVYTKSKIR